MSKQTKTSDPDYGCQPFKVMLPRKAVNMIKAKHKNVGAFIRGLIADELGADWPTDDLKIHSPAKPGHHEELQVIRPSRRNSEIQYAETASLPSIPAKPKRRNLKRHRRVNSVSNSLQTILRKQVMQEAEARYDTAHSNASHDPFEGLDLEQIAREAFSELHEELHSKTNSSQREKACDSGANET